MATNVQGTRTTSRPDGQTRVNETPNTTMGAAGVGGVEVFDNDVDAKTDPSLRPSASMMEDRAPIETRSSGSMLTWIIAAVVLIILVYFLLQLIF
ncbi:MAG: hypothetical protein IT328_01240 [Caldilineaceae bacterium]|nr:hypothetical protein [Caldilineaceae bacterium]